MERLSRLIHHLQPVQDSPTHSVSTQYTSGTNQFGNALSAEQRQFYEDNGYLIVRGLLSQIECNILNDRFTEYARNPAVRLPETVLMTDITR